MTTIVRAQVAHTPHKPFVDERGLSMLKEGLMAYQVQMLKGSGGVPLGPAHLLVAGRVV